MTTAETSANASWDVVVAGAGPAGTAAALAARAAGAARVLLVDMADGPGGALVAMGLRGIPTAGGAGDDAELAAADVRRSYRTTLIALRTGLELRLLSPSGVARARTKALVLATGGREQTRGNLLLPGTRPSGVLTAGAALRLLATTGRLPGRRAVLAGAGRWADTAARRLERAGAAIIAQVPEVATIEGWPRVTDAVLADGRRLACDLLVLATPLLAWLPELLPMPRLRGWRGGVFQMTLVLLPLIFVVAEARQKFAAASRPVASPTPTTEPSPDDYMNFGK